MDWITIISFIILVLTFVFTIASYWNQLSSQIVEISVNDPSYVDYVWYKFPYTHITVRIDNRGDYVLTVKSVKYYSNGKVIGIGVPDSPKRNISLHNVFISPGSKNAIGDEIPFESRPDKIVIKFNRRVSMFSKKISFKTSNKKSKIEKI